MKILVFSDSHGDLSLVDYVIGKYNPDRIFGCGDYDMDFYELDARNIVGVRGNSYFDPEWMIDRICEIDGIKFLFTHGHTHQVRSGLTSLSLFSRQNDVDITFFGHTHVAGIEEEDERYYINPGSITIPHFPEFPTCVFMDITENKIWIRIVDAATFDVFDEVLIDRLEWKKKKN